MYFKRQVNSDIIFDISEKYMLNIILKYSTQLDAQFMYGNTRKYKK